jgi:acyl carrier protein
MDNLETKLIKLTEQYSKPKETIHLDMDLLNDLYLDSLSLTELIVACEDEFNIVIDMDHPDTSKARTLRDLYNGIIDLIGPKAF